jgi:putative nucleotidyltransferase with HDIG domain
MRHRINPRDVREGMYVCGFSGSWFDHPFLWSRFIVREKRDLERIHASRVEYVVIDDDRGCGPAAVRDDRAASSAAEFAREGRKSPAWRIAAVGDDGAKARERSDRKTARALVSRAMGVLRNAFADVQLGRAVRMNEVTTLVNDVIATVERSPRTLLEVLRLKQKDEYTYMHSVAVCTLMVNVARQMGKGEAEIRDFGLAGLLHDLGKMGIPDAILNKAGKLTETEYLMVRNHPEQGYQILANSRNVPQMALDVCRHHHEKMDGSGYPFGLQADAISLVARLGAICDVYDALTSERVYKEAWTPVQALTAMWTWEGHFDRSLLFSFMQSIAVFPPGMLVCLRSNRLGVVLESKRRNARPRVLAFYDTRERDYIPAEEIVIQDNLANDSIVAPGHPEDWGISDWDRLSQRLLGGVRDLRKVA